MRHFRRNAVRLRLRRDGPHDPQERQRADPAGPGVRPEREQGASDRRDGQGDGLRVRPAGAAPAAHR